VCQPVRVAVILAGNPEPFETAQDDVEPTVVERLGVRDDPGAADRKHWRSSLVVRLMPRPQQDHADDTVPAKRIADHCPVSRLEDMERQEYVWEEDDARERKEGDDWRQHSQVEK